MRLMMIRWMPSQLAVKEGAVRPDNVSDRDIKANDLAAVKELLASGVDPNPKTSGDSTTLHYACASPPASYTTPRLARTLLSVWCSMADYTDSPDGGCARSVAGTPRLLACASR